MEYQYERADANYYLAPSVWIDHDHAAVADTARRIERASTSARDYLEQAFLFVRDAVSHSNDLPPGERRITRTASEALVQRQGLCYTKSFAFAALLRWKGIPAGLCYQRLRNGKPTIHGLTAVHIADESQWLRLDTRGPGRPGFTLAADALYYVADPAKEEIDYPCIYAVPDRAVTDALTSHNDFAALSDNLPGSLHGFDPQ
ncbi:MAG: transglutaminase family protein [Planctomycetes bacterium]|nr:transglutaminase family protein [Planctomycetota bacterium]